MNVPPVLVISGRYGRLANRLWTCANVLAFARDRGFRVVNPAFRDFAHYFATPAEQASQAAVDFRRAFALPWYWQALFSLTYKINLRTGWFPNIELGESGRLILEDSQETTDFFSRYRLSFLSGFYFCAPKCLERHGDTVREAFVPKVNLTNKIERTVRELRNRADMVIGIHMRQGDYRTYCDGIMFYSSAEYYEVMKSLAKQLPNRRLCFLICSDEEQDAAYFSGLDVVVSNGGAIDDLYRLAQCDYIVGPNSTYSQWSSWWGKVPLHVLDWRAAINHGKKKPIFSPNLKSDFDVFKAVDFFRYSDRLCKINEFI